MANETKLVQNCTKKLESMNQVPVDSRPKTLLKLKHTLEKERNVIYLSDGLKHLLTMDCQKYTEGKQRVKIYKTDKELDREVVLHARELASELPRQLFVLPCDSQLTEKVIEQLKAWYKTRDTASIDPTSPSRDVATACLIDGTIHRDVIYTLQTLRLLKIENGMIFYNFPNKKAIEVLKTAFDSWNTQMNGSLSCMSASSYGRFALLIKEANDELQRAALEEIDGFCKRQIIRWYPRLSREDVMETENITHSDINETGSSFRTSVKEGVNRGTCINQPMYLWPVSLEPEIAFVILLISETKNKPKTFNDLVSFITSHGKILYVTSPKQALLQIHNENEPVKSSNTSGTDVSLNIYLGATLMDTKSDMNSARWLASFLKLPGQTKRHKGGDRMENLRQKFDRMDTSTDHVKEKFYSFQRHVLSTAKHQAQRTGSLLLSGDADADRRCHAALETYIASNSGDTEDVFSRTIVKKCCEHETVPVDYLVDLLVQDGYLKIINEAVHYKKDLYIRKSTEDDSLTEERNLSGWEAFYKPVAGEKLGDAMQVASTPTSGNVMQEASASTSGDVMQEASASTSGDVMQMAETPTCCRKRRNSYVRCDAKRQKMMEVISI